MIIEILKKGVVYLCLFPMSLVAQIEISDFSNVDSKRIEKYDSSYFKPNYKFNNLPVMNGLIGHTIIFLEKPLLKIEIFQNGNKQSSNSSFNKYLFQNCKIEKVIGGKFYLSCLGDSIMYEPTFSDDKSIIIKEGFEKLKSKHIGKKYYSLSALKFLSLDNQEIQVSKGQVLIIENIEIVKLSSIEMGIGFKFLNQNNRFIIALPFDDYYFEYGGDPKGKLDFTFEYINKLELLDDNLNNLINKSLFKKNILKNEIVVGMTEKEIRIVWGMPTRDKMAAGFDKIMIYEAGTSTYYLYLKGKKLVKISQI